MPLFFAVNPTGRIGLILSACWISFLTSCSDSADKVVDLPSVSQAFIVCEGNFGSRNASLSILDTVETDTTFNDVFAAVNGRRMGDHAHSMFVKDSLGFMAVTGSDKIEVINTRTYESISSIDVVSSPRNITGYNGTMLITGYTDSIMVVVDASTYEEEFSVKLEHRPDEIAVLNGKAYVSNAPNMNDSVISVVDLTSHEVDTIMLTKNPVALVADPVRNRIYVACSGSGSNGYIAVIDGAGGSVVAKLDEFNNIKPVKLALRDSLLACIVSSNGPIRIYNVEQLSLVSSISGNYNALAFGEGELFAADGLDYISNGDLIWFSRTFQIRQKFKVGRSPAAIIFKPE